MGNQPEPVLILIIIYRRCVVQLLLVEAERFFAKTQFNAFLRKNGATPKWIASIPAMNWVVLVKTDWQKQRYAMDMPIVQMAQTKLNVSVVTNQCSLATIILKNIARVAELSCAIRLYRGAMGWIIAEMERMRKNAR